MGQPSQAWNTSKICRGIYAYRRYIGIESTNITLIEETTPIIDSHIQSRRGTVGQSLPGTPGLLAEYY